MEKGRERETPSAGRRDQSPASASLPHRLTAAGLLVSPDAAPRRMPCQQNADRDCLSPFAPVSLTASLSIDVAAGDVPDSSARHLRRWPFAIANPSAGALLRQRGFRQPALQRSSTTRASTGTGFRRLPAMVRARSLLAAHPCTVGHGWTRVAGWQATRSRLRTPFRLL